MRQARHSVDAGGLMPRLLGQCTVSCVGIVLLCAAGFSCSRSSDSNAVPAGADAPSDVAPATRAAPEREVRIGDDYEQAVKLIYHSGANEFPCGYLRKSMDRDREVTSIYHTLSDGFVLSLHGDRRVGKLAGADEKWTVYSMSMADSHALMCHKGETSYNIKGLVFRDRRSYPEGLPATSIYLNMDHSEVMDRLRFYGWKPWVDDPADEVPTYANLQEPRRISAPGTWEFYELGARKLYLKFRSEDDTKMLEEIRRADGLPLEVFDQHVLTVERYRQAIAAALPEGWTATSGGRRDLPGIRVFIKGSPDGEWDSRSMHIRVFRPMSAAEFSKRRASLPGLNARRARLEKAAAEFTRDGKIVPRDRKDRGIRSAVYAVEWDIDRIPDFRTSKAAIRMCELPDDTRKDSGDALAAVRKVLRSVDPLGHADTTPK